MTTKLQTDSTAQYRIRFIIDDQASFEESNGESRPLTRAEYAGNEYRGCLEHPRAGSRPLSDTQQGIGVCTVCARRIQPIPYDEYLRYYGNPDRHVYLGCEVQRQCPCCEAWKTVGALGHIDMMDAGRP